LEEWITIQDLTHQEEEEQDEEQDQGTDRGSSS
jgi:hypothetical protein